MGNKCFNKSLEIEVDTPRTSLPVEGLQTQRVDDTGRFHVGVEKENQEAGDPVVVVERMLIRPTLGKTIPNKDLLRLLSFIFF